MEAVVDSSALVCVALAEPESPVFMEALLVTSAPLISAFNLFETKTVLQFRKGSLAVEHLDILLARMKARIVAFDAEQTNRAFAAYRLFGKGTSHRARLNLGDCAAYALAMSRGLPLLFKGDDFPATGIAAALPLLVPSPGRGP